MRYDIYKILDKLYQNIDLDYDEVYFVFRAFINNNLDLAIQTSFLTALKMKKESIIEIQAASDALKHSANNFPDHDFEIADIVGTGGDCSGSINISTISSIVASCLGFKIAKHGNRSVSSKTGSFDLLEQLGIDINIDINKSYECLLENNLCFLFARKLNPGLKNSKKARDILKTKTIFNILGPLLNPVNPSIMLVGVYSKDLILPMTKVLQNKNIKKFAVVYGSGIDEVAIHDKTYVAVNENNKIREFWLEPNDFGIKKYSLDDIKGGDPEYNKNLTIEILKGKGTDAQNAAVAVNVAMLMYANLDKDLKQNTLKVIDILKSGVCYKKLNKMIDFTNR